MSSRLLHCSALVAALVLSLLPARAQDGALDPTFGEGGIVRTSFEGEVVWAGLSMALQLDGKIFLASSLTDGIDMDFALVRYHPDGALDASFGEGGGVRLDLGEQGWGRAMVLQPDGRILLAGSSAEDLVLLRFAPDGTLDATFADGGVARLDLGESEFANAIALQPDGRVLVAGVVSYGTTSDGLLARFLPDGGLDPTFGTGGLVLMDVDEYDTPYDLALQPDGRILVAGRSGGSGARATLLRYLPDGTRDDGFGEDGVVRGEWGEVFSALALQPDGRIVVAGQWDDSHGRGPLVLYRYLADGTLDPAFISGPRPARTLLGGPALALAPDGRLLVGAVLFDEDRSFVLARYHPDGQIDAAFGTDGVVKPPLLYAIWPSVVLQPDGKALISAASSGDFVVARFLDAFTVGVEGGADAPAVLALSAPSPHPFREGARLTLTIPSPQPVRVAVYDALGREVAVLLDGPAEAGAHALALDGAGLAAGVYVVRAEGAGGVAARRVVRY